MVSARRVVTGAVLVFLALPVELVLIAGAFLCVLISFQAMNQTSGAIVSSGEERRYLLHVPPGYDRSRPTPLVISLHGAGGWPAQQMNTSRWNELADEQGFIVVYPAGSGLPMIWHVERGEGVTREVRFISDLIDKLEAAYNIDAARIYANGLSNGGGMSFALSCALPDRIAAVGMVGAAHTLPWSWCDSPSPVPMIAFHGTADRMAPYHGGRSPVAPDPFPGIPEWTANWARRNRCDPVPIDAAVAADVVRREYSGCADHSAVVLFTVSGLGHQWPGGKPMPSWMVGPASDAVDATSRMWAFFLEHPLRPTTNGSRRN
jgi:polyhydroxybutyrate depolymerase